MPHGGCQGLYPDPEAGCGGGAWQQNSTFGAADDKEEDCCNEISCHLKNGLFEANLEVEGNIDCLGTVTAPTFQGNINVQSWKGFDIQHPSKKNHRLRYVCLEGPELVFMQEVVLLALIRFISQIIGEIWSMLRLFRFT